MFFFFQAEDGIRDLVRSRGLGDVYKRQLVDDAQNLLRRIIDEKLLVARAVVGFWPAARVGSDDIEVYTDETRSARLAVLLSLIHISEPTRPY